jgi:prepilin-type N-terminal cleavage/methylation domain-containing protein
MRDQLKAERGFTMVEVLVAIMILAIAAMTTFGLLSAATRNNQRAQASQVALEYAEQELEYLASLKDEKLALTKTPPASLNAMNPDYRVSGAAFALDREPVGNPHEMIVNGRSIYGGGTVAGGVVSPGPTPFTSGNVSGQVYRYVVWRNDERCGTACPGPEDYKQIVVAVKLDSPPNLAAERGYVEVQSNFVEPTKNAEDDPIANSEGKVVTAQQFFLTDTPCSSSGVVSRREITADHSLHNTLGTCANGEQTGANPGAPDALLLGSPPDPAPENELEPLEYEYSTDYPLAPGNNSDRGLQLRKEESKGCYSSPPHATGQAERIHRWVTDPMSADFEMSGKVTLSFFTKTVNESISKGRLCVFLFVRNAAETADTYLTNLSGGTSYWTFTPEKNANWPTSWTNELLTMTLSKAPKTILAGERLGLALGLEAENTPADALQIMYDHPNFPTRLEVETSTPIEGS